ncbi:nitrite reductase (NAD(P)H) small subunit [Streptomyces durbertensis]|uniref:Nitrite reductase (NAD(P)H) small subunit n=1 Tax=Streptomyces durbertensis TaxID=2448886 RepID=A0ABR6EBY3_9ACTN|nr:nitrite reductase (NAD(P)H) small subunit family protein [Streptomyces durbertensis]MBB1242841.1 nitrite reductase (NAD(P)H) small subunit [Streptomyces durbertensis]
MTAPTATLPKPSEATNTVIEVRFEGGWAPVCEPAALLPGRGVAALLPDGTQIAVFLDREGRPYAIGNRDPFTGAYVLSRGLLGSTGGVPFVASPLLKQRFELTTGRCLDDGDGEETRVPVFPARIGPVAG